MREIDERDCQHGMADTQQAENERLRCGVSRAEWHDKAWALFHAKTFDDTSLAKVNIHTIRAVFDATYDALMTPNVK